MPGFPVPFIKFREDTNGGLPLAGGKLWSYEAGTSTPLATYTTHVVPPSVSPVPVPNTNPVILDAQGRASVYIPDGVGYKFVLMDALDNIIWTEDNVQVPEIQAPEPPSEVPTGGIVMYAGTVAPAGWLMCDGAAVSRFTYANLFAVVLERFGAGNGTTTFATPDMRLRFPIGVSASGGGGVVATVGAVGGDFNHTHTGPNHTHPITAHTHQVLAHTHPVPYSGWSKVGPSNPDVSGTLLVGNGTGINNWQPNSDRTSGASTETATGTNTVGVATESGGTAITGQANPPYCAVNFIIKT